MLRVDLILPTTLASFARDEVFELQALNLPDLLMPSHVMLASDITAPTITTAYLSETPSNCLGHVFVISRTLKLCLAYVLNIQISESLPTAVLSLSSIVPATVIQQVQIRNTLNEPVLYFITVLGDPSVTADAEITVNALSEASVIARWSPLLPGITAARLRLTSDLVMRLTTDLVA